jgi:anti-sigma factor RsiW
VTVHHDLRCRELIELLSDYLDGAIPQPDRAVIDDHLAACDGCTRVVDQLRQTIRIAGTLTPDDVPIEQRDALLGAFRSWRRSAPPVA